MDIQEASRSLRESVLEARDEPIVVTTDGKPIAVVVPIENADLESISLSTNPEFMAIIERSRARQEREGGISSKEMRRRLRSPKRKTRGQASGESRT
jgi:prevent-host-death family protein